jgi:hypothetical protein
MDNHQDHQILTPRSDRSHIPQNVDVKEIILQLQHEFSALIDDKFL